jgi:hypothetical protein
MMSEEQDLQNEEVEIAETDAVDLIEENSEVRFAAKEADPLRIEATLNVYYTGVAGCGDQNTVNKECEAVWRKWYNKQIEEQSNRVWKRSGITGGKITSHYRRPIGGARSCYSTGNIKVFIEFW